MWLEVHEQDRKMLQNNKKEEKGRGWSLGWWEVALWSCQGSNLPAQSRRRNNCRERAETCHLDTASSTGKNVTDNLQTCNAHLSVLKPVSYL